MDFQALIIHQGKFSSICYLIYLLNAKPIILMELLSTAPFTADPLIVQDFDQSSFKYKGCIFCGCFFISVVVLAFYSLVLVEHSSNEDLLCLAKVATTQFDGDLLPADPPLDDTPLSSQGFDLEGFLISP